MFSNFKIKWIFITDNNGNRTYTYCTAPIKCTGKQCEERDQNNNNFT